jgi:tetratricopeptide (TPR) repeat protein
LAILPFRTSDPLNQAFADGLNDIISYKLARLEQFQGSLLVMPAAQVNDKAVKTPSVARERLGANLAIEGTVLRAGDRLQAVMGLVDTRTLTGLRSATVETPSSEVTLFRDRVMNTVTQMLDLEVTAQALRVLGAGDTSDPTAYSYYLEGRGYLLRADRAENLDKAITSFKQALLKDAKYALAYAGVAEASLRRYGRTKDPSDINAADANGERAIDLNDQLEPIHLTMGQIQAARGLYKEAEAEFRRVLTLNPVSPEAYRGLAGTYESTSRLKEAEDTYKSAIALRPNDWTSYNLFGIFFFNHHRYAEAESSFKKVAGLIPDNALAFNNLGATYLEMGKAPDAVAMYEKSLKLEESALAYSNLGMAYYFARQYQRAAPLHQRATELAPGNEMYWGNLGHARRWDPQLAAQAPEAYRRAIELGEQSLGINPRDAGVHARLATYWAALGEKDTSLEEIDKALKIEHSGYVQYRAALVYEQAGYHDRALRSVQSALELGYSLMEIQNAVPLKSLREDPRYRKLLDQRTSPPTPSSSKQ